MENAPSKIEQRRNPRIMVDFPAVVIWKGIKFHCAASQLSEAGVLLAIPPEELLEEDIQLELILQAPSPTLLLTGTVIYVIPSEIAVRFKEIFPEQRLVLQTYIQAHENGTLKL